MPAKKRSGRPGATTGRVTPKGTRPETPKPHRDALPGAAPTGPSPAVSPVPGRARNFVPPSTGRTGHRGNR